MDKITVQPPMSDCISCRSRKGAVAIDGWGRGYYDSRDGVLMLVLERGVGQCLQIDDELEVVVLEVGEGMVRLGVIRPGDE